MARRLNFTGRTKINRADVTFRILQEGDRLAFDADFRLAEYKLDPAATVHVEAYRSASTLWKRFDFGRVGLLHPPADRSLNEFGAAEGILFRVKVSGTNESIGKLLAEADALRARMPNDDEGPGMPLMKTASGDSGAELWRLRFDPDMPVLVINSREAGWKSLAMEPAFRALVAPAAMRQILERALIVETGEFEDDEETCWQVRWLKFCERLPNLRECPGAVDEQDGPTAEAVEEWIDEAVSAFCGRAGLLDRFLEAREGDKPS